jgi:hypothetical protein
LRQKKKKSTDSTQCRWLNTIHNDFKYVWHSILNYKYSFLFMILLYILLITVYYFVLTVVLFLYLVVQNSNPKMKMAMHIARMKFVHTSLFRLNISGSLVYITQSQTDLNSLLIQDTVPTTPFIYFCPYPNSIFPFRFSIHDSILPIIKNYFYFLFCLSKILSFLLYNYNKK